LRIIKRDGRIAKFNSDKIVTAVSRAMASIGDVDERFAKEVAERVSSTINGSREISVEEIQDKVEDVLINSGRTKLAKTYILYRAKRAEIRGFREAIGVDDDLKLGVNALALLKQRYLKNINGSKETPSQLFKRVAKHVASAEKQYGSNPDYWSKVFYNLMANQIFLPNTPCLANAGNSDLNYLFACYAFEIGDSMEEILRTAKDCGMVQKSGGGVGLNFSKLRPTGDFVKSTQGIASGPVTFMRIFNTISDVIKQGGIRRGGNLGLLLINHPDIIEFIQCKMEEGDLSNFNISVAITDEFMRAVKNDSDFSLLNPKDGKVVKKVNARHLFRFIAESAWRNGEPGFVFWDKIEQDNPTPKQGHLIKNLALARGTKVFTTSGIYNIEDIGEVPVLTDLRSVHSNGVTSTLLTVIPQGVEPVYKVILNTGQSLRLTANHKVLVDVGGCRESFGYDSYQFVRADGLKKGDKICIQTIAPINVFDIDESALDYGRVIGWLLGDGNISKREPASYTFICNSEEVFAMRFLEKYCSRLGNVHFHKQKGNIFTMQVGNAKARDYFGVLSCDRDIPDCLLKNVSIMKGILQGLFSADGSANKKNRVINLTSINKNKIERVQLMLSYFGIKSSIYAHSCKRGVKYGDKVSNFSQAWMLNITGRDALAFRDIIGFYLSPQKDNIANTWSNYKAGGTETAEVVSVEPDGEDKVFEVVANTTHSLIVNGIVVSNCGEQDLLPYEACVLGSINLSKFVEDGQIVYNSLRKVVHHAVRFLDDVIDTSSYPLEVIEKRVKLNRKIGLGVMGFADMLFMLGIPYDSKEAEVIAEEVMDFINVEARKASIKLAEDRGSFPSINDSILTAPQRNATLTTIAPTGSISIIAETSSGIEPAFAIVYQKTNILENQTFFEVNPIFEIIAKREGWFSQILVNKIIKNGGRVTGLDEVPEKWQRVFRTALEVLPENHVRMQAAFQRHVNNSISKTINMPFGATVEDVEKILKLAYDLNLKGLTVFRNRSRQQQVLELCLECDGDSCSLS